MNKGMYAFSKNDDIFVVVCEKECPNEWNALKELDGLEFESDDMYYIMGTDAWGELEDTSSGKVLVYKSNEITFFKCPVSNEVLRLLSSASDDGTGFILILSEHPINQDDAYQSFIDQKIDGLICVFYTAEGRKKNH